MPPKLKIYPTIKATLQTARGFTDLMENTNYVSVVEQIEKFAESVKLMENEIDALSTRITTLTDDAKEQRAQVQKHQSTAEQLQKQILALQNSEYKALIKAKDLECVRVQNQKTIEQNMALISFLSQAQAVHQTKFDSMQNSLYSQMKESQKREEQAKVELLQKIDEGSKTQVQFENENKNLKIEVDRMRNDLKDLEKIDSDKRDELNQQIYKQQCDFVNYKTNAERNALALKDQINEIIAEKMAVNNKLAEYEFEIATLKDQMKIMNREHEEKEKQLLDEIAQLNVDLAKVQLQLTSESHMAMMESHSLSARNRQDDEQQQKLYDLQQKLIVKERTIEDLIKYRQNAEIQQQEQYQTIQFLKKQIELKANRKLDELESLCSVNQVKLQSQEGQLNELREENERLQNQLNTTQKSLQDTIIQSQTPETQTQKKIIQMQENTIKDLRKQLYELQLLHSDSPNMDQLFLRREADMLKRPTVLGPSQMRKQWGK